MSLSLSPPPSMSPPATPLLGDAYVRECHERYNSMILSHAMTTACSVHDPPPSPVRSEADDNDTPDINATENSVTDDHDRDSDPPVVPAARNPFLVPLPVHLPTPEPHSPHLPPTTKSVPVLTARRVLGRNRSASAPVPYDPTAFDQAPPVPPLPSRKRRRSVDEPIIPRGALKRRHGLPDIRVPLMVPWPVPPRADASAEVDVVAVLGLQEVERP
ncbi:hypothetical protein AMAG_11242 [Allomyces macrogynus ATCC 38327]|uniref:Uncharacterized protein n=1 Tax=Allomyces macrogynus (strain ATCC 38327) TaxID=578462 RepID=A0A0L0SWH8_ALLM3|nr:hypothetical protein AMAG_11242 [Allomyces macrogynus ATCC 38327]|eukprot:KNE66745.1 hypothetical protein AMAG_11242 [Allomyces macrogynus ATCC 38327]